MVNQFRLPSLAARFILRAYLCRPCQFSCGGWSHWSKLFCLPSQRKKQGPRAARRKSMALEDQPMSTCPFERPRVDIKRCTPDIVTRQGSEIENKRQNSHKFAVPSRSTMKEWWDVTSMREKLFLPTVICIGWRIEWDKKRMARRWYRPRSAILARPSGANHLNTR